MINIKTQIVISCMRQITIGNLIAVDKYKLTLLGILISLIKLSPTEDMEKCSRPT